MSRQEDYEDGLLRAFSQVLSHRPFDEHRVWSELDPILYLFRTQERVEFILSLPSLVKNLLNICETMCPRPIGICASIAIVNLCMFPPAHAQLLKGNVLEIALKNLHFLRDEAVNDELDCGLSAASMIIRTVGSEESGPGPEAIKGNPVLTAKLAWVLKSVLDTGMCLGFRWDPANILMDVSTLAKSDRNKPLLAAFVPLLCQAAEAPYNFRAIKYTVNALSQLVFDAQCRVEIVRLGNQLSIFLTRIDFTQYTELERAEVIKTTQVLLASIDDLLHPKPRRVSAAAQPQKSASKLASFLKGKSASAMASAVAAAEVPKTHIMISYQWDAQPTAIQLNDLLTANGYKTWFDLNDMGANINDSMAFAVENAHLVVCLFSRRYKESANCRKECEMADNLAVPMLFVKVEQDYKQEAWLSLVMGKALWVQWAGENDEATAWPQIEKRVRQAKPPTAMPLPPVVASPTLPTSPKSPTNTTNNNSEVKDMLKTLLDLVKDLKQENEEIKQSLLELKLKFNA
ncbi:hypothetical protein BASA81_007736 [Batrachochytrium salamandrivorans]|nr:hypothetical protein BASA81_007736 [Batrachochytrium salamandrivorans]